MTTESDSTDVPRGTPPTPPAAGVDNDLCVYRSDLEGRAAILANGCQVAAWRLVDGGWVWKFTRDGQTVPLRLSAEAMTAMIEVFQVLALGWPPMGDREVQS